VDREHQVLVELLEMLAEQILVLGLAVVLQDQVLVAVVAEQLPLQVHQVVAAIVLVAQVVLEEQTQLLVHLYYVAVAEEAVLVVMHSIAQVLTEMVHKEWAHTLQAEELVYQGIIPQTRHKAVGLE
jgi:hypothetical protein